ncbi:MAG: hypothetical protein P4L44_04680 [Oryzomonas sp.]|uniref:hypothetical protein n=1 Tax=Oryzomonas sp. TaxID=2855186 RepID=UPI0028439A26|nr:hypothetical protein [Oryzomonas sp.]MDR3579243.1 hypothetical protein [Oryzomonas sp.]
MTNILLILIQVLFPDRILLEYSLNESIMPKLLSMTNHTGLAANLQADGSPSGYTKLRWNLQSWWLSQSGFPVHVPSKQHGG